MIHSIFLSKVDYRGLKDLIHKYESKALDSRTSSLILILKEKLNKAQILESWNIKLIDVVMINSSVRFKNLSTQKKKEYLIVYPQAACKELGRISVFSDLGVALLGHKKGSIVEVKEIGIPKYKVQILDIQPTSLEWIKRLEERCEK